MACYHRASPNLRKIVHRGMKYRNEQRDRQNLVHTSENLLSIHWINEMKGTITTIQGRRNGFFGNHVEVNRPVQLNLKLLERYLVKALLPSSCKGKDMNEFCWCVGLRGGKEGVMLIFLHFIAWLKTMERKDVIVPALQLYFPHESAAWGRVRSPKVTPCRERYWWTPLHE